MRLYSSRLLSVADAPSAAPKPSVSSRLRYARNNGKRVSPDQIAISTYNKIAERYAALNFDDTSNLPYMDTFFSYLSKGAKILDAGCGPGGLVKYVLGKGYEAEGIDLSEEMIKIAQERIP